jgi:dolichol-phosphate mannosyltransferase
MDSIEVAGVPVTGVTVVVPTFNEAGNIGELLDRLSLVLDTRLSEIVIVDDSTDRTAEVATAQAARLPHRIRVVHRDVAVGGLSGAVITGIRLAEQPWVVVMDGDLQHPPETLPHLIAAAGTGEADIVIASRYQLDGDADGLDGMLRHLVSAASTLTARALFPRRLAACTDPMTGFFAVRRDALDLEALHPHGFKILLEILLRTPLVIAEIPFVFARRGTGGVQGVDGERTRLPPAADRVAARASSAGACRCRPLP